MLSKFTSLLITLLLLSPQVLAASLIAAGSMVTHSRDGLIASTTEGASSSNHYFELGAIYTLNDLMSLTYSVPLDSETPYSAPTKIICDGLAVNTDSITFGLLSSSLSAGKLIYRVIDIYNGSADASFDTVGLHCVIPAVQLSDTDLALVDSASVTLTTMTSMGRPIESATGIVANVVDSFSVAVNQVLDATVDVTASSKAFVGGTPDNSTDTLSITVSLNGVDGDILVKNAYANDTVSSDAASFAFPVISEIKYDVIGDFSFLDTDPNQVGMQLGGNAVSASNGTVTFSDDLQSLTVTDSDLILNPSSLVFLKTVMDTIIPNQPYSGSLQIVSDGGDISSTLSFTPGGWDWNGSSIMVYAVPFQEHISRSLLVSNQGAMSSDIVVSVIYDGVTYGSYELGSVEPASVRDFSVQLDDAMTENGDTIESGWANIILQVAGSDSNIVVFGSYQFDTSDIPVNLATSAQPVLVTP